MLTSSIYLSIYLSIYHFIYNAALCRHSQPGHNCYARWGERGCAWGRFTGWYVCGGGELSGGSYTLCRLQKHKRVTNAHTCTDTHTHTHTHTGSYRPLSLARSLSRSLTRLLALSFARARSLSLSLSPRARPRMVQRPGPSTLLSHRSVFSVFISTFISLCHVQLVNY